MPGSTTTEITPADIRDVRIYRGGIAAAAVALVAAAGLAGLTRAWAAPSATAWLAHHEPLLIGLVILLIAGTGTSVMKIHLYIRQFHLLLKVLFGIGLVATLLAALAAAVTSRHFLEILYLSPYGILGFGFILAALCGITVKEAFCFGMPEAIAFAVVTPVLVLGHLFGGLAPFTAFILLCGDAFLLSFFAVRKARMAADLDIGDKSIYMGE